VHYVNRPARQAAAGKVKNFAMSDQDSKPDARLPSGRDEAAGKPPAAAAAPEPELESEPELTTSLDELTLGEPVLGEARISNDVAAAASVDEAAAEAASVEQAAVAAGIMVGGPVEPEVAKATKDTGAAADAAETALPDLGAAGDAPEWLDQADDADRWENIFAAMVATAAPAEEPQDGNHAEKTPQEEAPAGQTPAEAPPAARFRPRNNRNGNGSKGPLSPLMLIIIAAVIGAVILVVAVASLLRGNGTGPEGAPADRPAAGTEGVIAQGVQPVDLQQADCMRDFVDANQPVTVVSCESPHNAQLVATFIYPEEDDFPGRDALAARGQELCGSVDFSATVDRFQPLSLTQARPTEESWQEGDRRVDCIVFSEEGNVITESLIG
jgi:hypothetical protein